MQAWNWRAMPNGSCSSIPSMPSAESSGPVTSAGYPIDSMKRRHTSCMCASGRCSDNRRTTSAAVTSALSVRYGCEP